MHQFFALTTRGLEKVSAQEINALESVSITEISYRRVAGQCKNSPSPLLSLRTVDDLFLEAARWTQITHTRDMLTRLQQASRELELASMVAACASIRPIPAKPNFSVSASFVGKRNYSANEIKMTVAEGVSARYPFTYTEDDRSADLNIRLFIEHDIAYVGVRLSKHPLHERPYQQVHRPGSLKPSVASAMLLMADVRPAMRVLDPCCGAGTILIEVAAMGAVALGGDIEAKAVDAARVNAASAQLSTQIEQWDARNIPLPDAHVDCVITNLPWGQQIVLGDALGQFYGDVCFEIERILVPGGRTVVLTGTPELLAFPGLTLEQSVEISLFGQTPTISVYSSNNSPTLRP